ncbi:MAG: hypothetical protein ABI361_09085 [Nitrososphaera sp.]
MLAPLAPVGPSTTSSDVAFLVVFVFFSLPSAVSTYLFLKVGEHGRYLPILALGIWSLIVLYFGVLSYLGHVLKYDGSGHDSDWLPTIVILVVANLAMYPTAYIAFRRR